MAPRNRVIIDTDPGCDDILALLLALSAPSSDLEILLISLTHGNVDVRSCLRNVVSTFHILEQEFSWRKSNSLPLGFDGVQSYKPLVSIGADEPLQDIIESADYFHGRDGLAGIHDSHPHLSPEEGWNRLFEKPPGDDLPTRAAEAQSHMDKETLKTFTPSLQPSHTEILRLLRENDPKTITLIAIGPLTNFALAAAEDPQTFLRAKELVCMGATVDPGIGNVTPVAEFNIYADPFAAARVFALSSDFPNSTMPVALAGEKSEKLAPYPEGVTQGEHGTLKIVLMSLDITEHHMLSRGQFVERAKPLADKGSPLANWLLTWMTPMLDKMERLHIGHEGEGAALALHDPMCIWYVLTQDDERWVAGRPDDGEGPLLPRDTKRPTWRAEDIRVETRGQWTRGMTVGDRRTRKRRNSDGERPYDRGEWLAKRAGNRIFRMLGSPGREVAAETLLDSIFRGV